MPELTKGVHLDVAASVAHSRRLGCLVRESDFSPNLVVGIREGGILPARIIADTLGAEIIGITVQRRISRAKHSAVLRHAARYLGSTLYRFPWVRRVLQALNRIPGRHVVATGAESLVGAESRILIVDDFSCTGETFLAAEKWLQDHGANPEHIRTAALIAAPDPSQSRVFYPSYMLANVSWVFFPWSSNSPHYSDYANWKRSHAL